MVDVLAKIIDTKREEVAALKASALAADLAAMASEQSAPRGFAKALDAASQDGYGLIAEVKKASPSKGLIRSDFDPEAIARAYQAGGATCLSVLTDRDYFQGDMDYMVAARAAVSLPVLRKDFMIDPLQITEARAFGADAILIIMAAVDDALALELEDAAFALGMDVLVEIHDAEELDRAKALKSPLLGINNRNLKTMETSLTTAETLLQDFPHGRIAVAESGLFTTDDLARMAKHHARCFLIGESLMRQEDVEAATASILSNPLPKVA
ncbi:MAG: indole-3-glycerol phosphate synthase TrpC [Alphaproteobacteria bacterium]|jgi:indole-3-glycerol phosphate synthase|nr:indole-3-glycerol phosphate synthase TrpC [Alphaproteobacteria bacterium]